MLKIRTNTPGTDERGIIKCQGIVRFDKGLFSCFDVDTMSGSTEVIDYHHGTHQIDVIIPTDNLSTVKAIKTRGII